MSDEPEGVVIPSPTISGSHNLNFNFGDGELVYLKEFARKALSISWDGYLTASSRKYDINDMEMRYRDEVIKSADGVMTLTAMAIEIRSVIDGKRTVAQARSYIARVILKCRIDELEGRK